MSGCPGWESVNPVCRGKQLLGGAANDVFSSIANYFGKAAGAAVKWLWEQIESATAVSLTGPGLKTDLEASGAVAALIATCLFLIQLIASMLRQEPGGLLRAVRGLGVAFIGAAMAIGSTQILLGAIDALSNGVVKFATGTNVRGMGAKLVAGEALSGGNPAGVLLMSLVLLAAVVVVWCAMMIRKMLIIVSAVFAPIAFAGSTADITRGWVRKWIEFTVALAFSKLVLVIMFMIGLSVLDGAGQAGGGAGQDMTQLAIGALVLLLAGFAPWLAIKFVHFAGDSFAAG
ncbi:MAG: hypothetical protein J2P57_23410, partial [Acidimicrobiaceae bacterium]|nr:hypothetical protein [Acidimicrobiaceae bacterium]